MPVNIESHPLCHNRKYLLPFSGHFLGELGLPFLLLFGKKALGYVDATAADLEQIKQYDNTTHTHPFNGPLSGTTRVSRYQKGKQIWI